MFALLKLQNKHEIMCRDIFKKKTFAKKIFYRRKLYSAFMVTGHNMTEHIRYIKTLAERLQAIDDKLAEKDLVIILISKLPEEYDHLITAVVYNLGVLKHFAPGVFWTWEY